MAISLFDGVNLGRWSEVSRNKIPAQELSKIKSAVVEKNDFGGTQVMFLMVNGDKCPRKLGMNSEGKFAEGEVIDPTKVELVQLRKTGSEDIIRVEIAD